MPQWIVKKTVKFDAAHNLPHHAGKCANMHGHTWKMEIAVKADRLHDTGPETGMVMDFTVIKGYVKAIVEDYLDHKDLTMTLPLESTTSEAIAQWMYGKLKPALPGLCSVGVWETEGSYCEYTE